MAVKIRLSRRGKKKSPFYRIVVSDSRTPLKSRYIELIGHYDPRRKEVFQLKQDRIQHWISKGAKPTPAVLSLMKRADKEQEPKKEAEDEGTD